MNANDFMLPTAPAARSFGDPTVAVTSSLAQRVQTCPAFSSRLLK